MTQGWNELNYEDANDFGGGGGAGAWWCDDGNDKQNIL
jgi:hypothetical protein